MSASVHAAPYRSSTPFGSITSSKGLAEAPSFRFLSLQELSTHWSFFFAKILNESCESFAFSPRLPRQRKVCATSKSRLSSMPLLSAVNKQALAVSASHVQIDHERQLFLYCSRA